MNKLVESSPKVDKSITFYYCTVLYSNLWRTTAYIRQFLEKKQQIVSDLRPRPPIIGASHLYLGGGFNSNAGTDFNLT